MDRAQRPDLHSGSGPSASGGGTPAPSGSIPDIRAAQNAGGTYFLGRYRVVDEIGIGGMASVHLARMDGPGGFQKWVAIKKIHPHLVEDESFVQMFLDEARVAARISHPNVATVFDLGKHEDTYWIAMEYLHGEPLREVMRRTEELGTAMPPEIACRVIADAAEGLHAAHELLGKNGEKLGLVHRDVTPHNLFVTYDGVTKVVDFGIAKFSSRMSHTRAGTLKGKLAYMSPEQVHGEGIDRRTDIFALGVVLWELTTGQRLFRMESDLDTLAKVQECNVPRPSTLIRGYPVDLEKIVMKALAKNRGERFKTARELSRALQSLLMRRGLFIASDEVAAYTQSIFQDRIQKREAHLRWAAEVTQTINVEQMLSKPQIGHEFTNSEVQAAQGQSAKQPVAAPVRPAAGMPVPDPSLKQTGPSAATAPRPAAGMPPRAGPPVPRATAPRGAPHQGEEEEAHPADGDGPTVQAMPEMLEESITGREPMRSEPPTLMESSPATNEGPTVMAPLGRLPNAAAPEDEDQDETIVAKQAADHHQGGALKAPPTFPQPSGRPQPGAQGQPPRFNQTGPMNAAHGQHPAMQSMSYPATAQSQGSEAFAETLGLGQKSPLAPQQSMMGDFPRHQPHPTGPQPDFYARQHSPSQRMPQPMPRIGGMPTYDNRTMTAERFKRRPPMWVVAALSCSIALLLAGIVVAIYAATGSSSPSPHADGSGQTTATAPPQAPVTPGTGPFTSARTAFNTVTSGPTSAVAPPVPAAPAAAPPPVAPPPVLAANDPAPPVAPPPVAAPAAPPPAAAPPAAKPEAPRPAAAAPAARPDPPPAAKPTPAAPSKPAALGAITVVCMPKCDQIIDNGTPLGPGHIFNRPVPAGRHVLVLSAPNGVKKNLQVEVAPEQTREVRIPMDK